jgi:hypothetical protein
MRMFCRLGGVLVSLLFVGPGGCATAPPPPSESIIPILRAYHRDLVASISSGASTSDQARDAYYAKLEAIQPPLPDLDSLKELRAQLAGRVASGHLTQEQAESSLHARELDLLKRWKDMAAQYATEQREIRRFRDEHEEGLWRQKQIEQGEKVFRDRPRL